MKRMELLDQFLEVMNQGKLLKEVVRQMSEDEAKECFSFIDRMHELGIMNEEDK